MNRVCAIIILATLIGCSSNGYGISSYISKQVENPEVTSIDLRDIQVPEWDRFCAIAPYATNERIELQLGFKWNAIARSKIGGHDNINLLVFVKGKEVVAYADHPRGQGDFIKLEPRCLGKDKAVLNITRDSHGWVQLVSANQQ